MKKRTKIIIITISVLLLLCVGALGFVGNYFYTLAIDSHSDKTIVLGSGKPTPAQAAIQKKSYQEMMDRDTKEVWLTNKEHYKLHAYEIKNDSPIWVVAVHGYMSQAKELSDVANTFASMGYNVLLPDLRGHGKSQGDNIGMGDWDSDDILEWISMINKQNPNAQILLYGVSMGASTILMDTGKKQLPSNVFAAIEDCGYTTAWKEFSYQLKKIFGLPTFPVLDAANIVTMLRAGYNLKDADALSAVKKSHTPTLFIHGSADDFVPTKMVYSLYDAATCKKQLLIIKGAAHAKSRSVDPTTYWSTIKQFIHTYAPKKST